MRKTLIVLLVAIVFAGKAMGLTLTTPDGIEIEYECMVETPGAATIPNPEIRIVFIRFPQANAGGYLGYPNWATPSPTVPSWLENEIGSYLNAMSVGAQQPQVEIVVDPMNPTRPWTAANPASFYAAQGPSACNHEIFLAIENAYPGYWIGVQYIFVIAYDQSFDPVYTTGGIAPGLGGIIHGGAGVPGLTATGFTSHLFVRTDLTPVRDAFDTAQNHAYPGVVGHEYGHVLGMHHSPYSGNYQYNSGFGGSGRDSRSGPCAGQSEPPRYHLAGPPPPCGPSIPAYPNCICIGCGHAEQAECTDPIYVNMGRYDVLRGFGSNEPPERVNPYHPIQLFEHTPWLGKVEITSDVRDFHIPQLRNSDPAKRKVYVVKPQPLSGQYFNQYFLLSNHQGDAGSPILQFDANYQGKGLLIWHVLPAKAWDLESAGGEVPDVRLGQIFDPIPPGAPILRGDALARSWTFAGSGADFYSDFYGVTDFSATTNPNSNYYSEFFDFFSPQDVVSHIGVENIRQDASGDMIVDIYVDPKQYLTSPNGGEVIPAGNPLTVTWLHRPNAAISTVNIAISSNGGQTYDPLFGVSNTSGQYTIPPLYGFLSTQNRIKITSLDATTNAFDESDANFTRWGINQDSTFQPTITHRCIGTTPKVKVSVNFTTSVASDGDDVLQVFTNSSCTGTPIGTATVANPSHTPKTTHTIWWEGTCSGSPGAFYVVVKSQHGSGWAASQCTYVGTVTCISCGACSPPPCVYD